MNEDYESGQLYYEAGDFQKAEQAFLFFLKQHPNHAMAYNKLGLVYVKIKRDEEAKHCFNQAVTYDPDLFQAWNNLGNLARQEGELERSREYYLKALQLDPNHPVPKRNLAQVEKQLKRSPGILNALWKK